MTERNLRNEAYNIVMSFINETAIKEVNYDEMTGRGKGVTELATGTIMGIDFRVVFYEMGHPCAYIKIPEYAETLRNILRTEGYNEIPCQTCHCGMTFGQWTSDDDPRGFSKGRWIGWDYGHLGDYAGYYDTTDFNKEFIEGLRRWTTTDILIEVVEQILALKEGGYL